MSRPVACAFFGALLLASLFACSRADQQNADRKAAEAKQKARVEGQRVREGARKLGQEAKQEASSLRQNIDRALQGTGPAQGGGAGQAGEKLRRGEHDLRVARDQAAVKLDHAAMVAKIKAKLASDVGLSTVTGIDVDTSGQVVTLRGTVASNEQKQQAEQAVMQLSSVTRVVNQLTVKP